MTNIEHALQIIHVRISNSVKYADTDAKRNSVEAAQKAYNTIIEYLQAMTKELEELKAQLQQEGNELLKVQTKERIEYNNSIIDKWLASDLMRENERLMAMVSRQSVPRSLQELLSGIGELTEIDLAQ